MRLAPTALGVLLLLAALGGGVIGYNDGGDHTITIPDCTLGVAGLQAGDVCDEAAMMKEPIPVPEEVVGMLDVGLSVKWDKDGVWFGLVDASEASKCQESGTTYLLCDPDDLTFIAGGPNSSGTFEWVAEAGEYRIVGGASADSSGDEVAISYSYHVTLFTSATAGIAAVGGLIAIWGATRSSDY